jgi:anhydro-N-acetylmuramic acid kinase
MMKPLRALGLMSGTSMDGVDAAIVITDGVEDITYGPARALAYDEETRQILRDARGWGEASLAEARVTHVHSPACVGPFDPAPELIGFHGQTLAHDPQNARTRQIGDGAALANAWGAPTVWDFRSGDRRAGRPTRAALSFSRAARKRAGRHGCDCEYRRCRECHMG